MVAYRAALGQVPSEQLAANTPPARRAAALSRRAASPAKTPQGFAHILPCAAWAGASSSYTSPIPQGCRLSPWTHPNHNSRIHRQVRSGTMGPRISWARLLRLVLPRYGAATKSSSNSQQHRRKLQRAAVDHGMIHPARSTNEKQ